MPKSFTVEALYAAQLGYDDCENFHREGSSLWLWHEAGAYCRRAGLDRPQIVQRQIGAVLMINHALLRWIGPVFEPESQDFILVEEEDIYDVREHRPDLESYQSGQPHQRPRYHSHRVDA